MRGSIIKRCLVVLISLVVTSFFTISYAHPGRTDANGGHKDNKNKSGLGSYHYHCGGYEAHLHENGYCPYTSNGKVTQSNENEKIVETIKPAVPIKEEPKEIINEVIEEEKIKQESKELNEEIKVVNPIEEEHSKQEPIETKDEKELDKPNEQEKLKQELIEVEEEKTIDKDNIELKKEDIEGEINIEKVAQSNEKREEKEDIINSNEELFAEENIVDTEDIKENTKIDTTEEENGGATSVVGTMIALGGAGYLAYKKFN